MFQYSSADKIIYLRDIFKQVGHNSNYVRLVFCILQNKPASNDISVAHNVYKEYKKKGCTKQKLHPVRFPELFIYILPKELLHLHKYKLQ